MRPATTLIFAVLLICGLGDRVVGPASSKEPFTIETLKFKTNVVPDTTNDHDVEVEATLYLPRRGRQLHPGDVITLESISVRVTAAESPEH